MNYEVYIYPSKNIPLCLSASVAMNNVPLWL